MKLVGLLPHGAELPHLAAPCSVWPTKTDRVVCVWPRDEVEASEAWRELSAFAAPLLAVREAVHWDTLRPGDADRVALIFFVRRRPAMAYAAFEDHYRNRHAALAREHHPGIARYVQNFLSEASDEPHPFDAVSELWFRDDDDRRERFYRDATSEAVIAEDVARFLDPAAGLVRLIRPGLADSPGESGSGPGGPR